MVKSVTVYNSPVARLIELLAAVLVSSTRVIPEASITRSFTTSKAAIQVFKSAKSESAEASIVRTAVSIPKSELASQLAVVTVLATSKHEATVVGVVFSAEQSPKGGFTSTVAVVILPAAPSVINVYNIVLEAAIV